MVGVITAKCDHASKDRWRAEQDQIVLHGLVSDEWAVPVMNDV
jgi:hypothetical protein